MLLSLFAYPFFASLIAFSLPKISKQLAVGLSLVTLLQLLYHHHEWIGSSVNLDWLPTLSINFHLGADALTLLFLYLTAILVPISLIAANNVAMPNTFYGLILLLQGLLVGFFTARNLFLFVLFFEAMLIPLYFIIGYWGKANRREAALKFLIYMIAGSALMVAAVLGLYFFGPRTFEFDQLKNIAIPYAPLLAAVFLLAFAVKTPLFPFHAWLPDAYCAAPTTGTILLSGLLSKAGIYGILRIVLEIFPDVIKAWSPWLLGLSIIGVFYGGLAAWRQTDYKRLIAYSSFSHVNFILAGLFIWSETAQSGAILQAINHGLTIAALFLAAGWLEERLGSTEMSQGTGLAKYLPRLTWWTLFFVLAAVAVPGTNSFVGELMILYGLFVQHPYVAAFLVLSIILSVMYMLRWLEKVYFGHPMQSQAKDIQGKDISVALCLAALILWIGIYPAPFLKLTKSAAEKIGGLS